MKNLLYIAALGLLIVGCSKPTIEDEGFAITHEEQSNVVNSGTTTGTTTTTASSTTTTQTAESDSSTNTTAGTDVSSSTVDPKSQEEVDQENEVQNCNNTYLDYTETCADLNTDVTFIHNRLGVRNGHTLRHDQQTYINIYDVAKSRTNDEFENVIGHLPTIIEDNTESGSYSFAGTCGTSWHDGSVIETEPIVGTLVHEWGHVWHSQMNYCLQEEIRNAYDAQVAAYEAGTGYPQLLDNVGPKDNPTMAFTGRRPYQLANEGEYMACNIAAYFNSPQGAGTIESRQQLMEIDPVIFELISEMLN